MSSFRLVRLLLPASFFFAASVAMAQRSPLSARDALGLVASQYGPQAVQWVAEMRAQGGVPQPSDWQILAFEQRAPRLLYRFWAGGGRAGDGGPDDMRYPDDVPVGYFNASQIAVDSVAAFTIAEGEARKARMAFDSCDYLLRLREYSSEPVWRLELIDATRRLVGKIYLSATSGQVMRTVWIYRDQRARPDGLPLILDSAAPGGGTPPAELSGAPGAAPGSVSPGSLAAPSGLMTGQIPGQVPPRIPGSPGTIGSIGGMLPGVPSPPSPGVSLGGVQPYAPVDSNGRPITPRMSDPGIPSPPPATPPTASIPSIPAPPASSTPAPVPAPAPVPPVSDPAKPPVSGSSGGGDSNRIPPPPIPR